MVLAQSRQISSRLAHGEIHGKQSQFHLSKLCKKTHRYHTTLVATLFRSETSMNWLRLAEEAGRAHLLVDG